MKIELYANLDKLQDVSQKQLILEKKMYSPCQTDFISK
jgi:hypothetical protein